MAPAIIVPARAGSRASRVTGSARAAPRRVACAALLAACGGSSGGAAAAASPRARRPTPVPSPQITSGEPPAAAVDAVRTFWTLVGEGKLAEAKAHCWSPRARRSMQWTPSETASPRPRFVRVVPDSVGRGAGAGATIEFAVDVWIEQHPTSPSASGATRASTSCSSTSCACPTARWRMWDSGTGP